MFVRDPKHDANESAEEDDDEEVGDRAQVLEFFSSNFKHFDVILNNFKFCILFYA